MTTNIPLATPFAVTTDIYQAALRYRGAQSDEAAAQFPWPQKIMDWIDDTDMVFDEAYWAIVESTPPTVAIEAIKASVIAGERVYWMHAGYEVRQSSGDRFSILCTMNDDSIGLHDRQGKGLNGRLYDFFIRYDVEVSHD